MTKSAKSKPSRPSRDDEVICAYVAYARAKVGPAVVLAVVETVLRMGDAHPRLIEEACIREIAKIDPQLAIRAASRLAADPAATPDLDNPRDR
jgi:hypothetical protein